MIKFFTLLIIFFILNFFLPGAMFINIMFFMAGGTAALFLGND